MEGQRGTGSGPTKEARKRKLRGSEKEDKVSNPLYSHKPTGYASKISLLLASFFGLFLKIMK